MKATFDAKAMRVTLDNEAVKAIRFCKGWNTDLRVSLKTVDKGRLWWWLDENLINIIGVSAWNPVDPTDPKWSKYERMLYDMANQIIR